MEPDRLLSSDEQHVEEGQRGPSRFCCEETVPTEEKLRARATSSRTTNGALASSVFFSIANCQRPHLDDSTADDLIMNDDQWEPSSFSAADNLFMGDDLWGASSFFSAADNLNMDNLIMDDERWESSSSSSSAADEPYNGWK
mmetsp:Transcript_12666/g.27345  ORF Transcript_12666/g.27345 Transcript_12666/m.27345 type:complete len:142 (-) Transcript_12666:159-584(-)